MTEAPSQDTQKVASLIPGTKLAMLTTTAPDGTLTSRPMGLQETDFDGSLWFFTEHDSRKILHIAANPQVNVTISAPVSATWVSLTGTATEIDDPARKRDLWNGGVEAWFPDARSSTRTVTWSRAASMHGPRPGFLLQDMQGQRRLAHHSLGAKRPRSSRLTPAYRAAAIVSTAARAIASRVG